MLMISGEVRKVLPSSYVNRQTGEKVGQSILVLEPTDGRQNYEVYLNSQQIQNGAVSAWESLKGKTVAVEVSLYVNHQHNFYKFSAVGDAKPLKPLEVR